MDRKRYEELCRRYQVDLKRIARLYQQKLEQARLGQQGSVKQEAERPKCLSLPVVRRQG